LSVSSLFDVLVSMLPDVLYRVKKKGEHFLYPPHVER
jgi:hypothetical protein